MLTNFMYQRDSCERENPPYGEMLYIHYSWDMCLLKHMILRDAVDHTAISIL